MEIAVEIRHMKLHDRAQLCSILQLQDSWKCLMAIIPKTLSKNEYRSDISLHNPSKYRSEHFRMIEDFSAKTTKSCAEILFDEWGTSDRVRPTFGHLKYLLEKAQLFRAADYVAVNIMRQKPSPRPSKGPSAPVVLKPEEDKELQRIVQILDGIDYPSSAIENIHNMNSINTNLNYSTREKATVIPKIVISESPDVDEVSPPAFTIPVVIQNERVIKPVSDMIRFSKDSVSNSDNNPVSDMIKFSTVAVSDSDVPNLPQLSTLLDNSESSSSDIITNNSNNTINNSDTNSNSNSEGTTEVNYPQLSSLLSCSQSSAFEANIPNISQLSGSSSSVESSSNLPAFSQLIADPESKTVTSKSSRCCSSPLPNLSLNTLLPHFTYYELENATNVFEETPLTENGRFLGSGAFGKVYLAVGLFSKPVAVKKLLLENDEEVLIGDTVTKQFRNEVEVLSKYKHENLLSLLGYSCDGCTYCLLYEYIPGGALTDRLQKRELIWTERIYIAMGAAKAISYLHTAYSTPLIHRDVKSANILLDYTNKPKLCDFGLIKLSPSANTNTGTTIFGTSAYMAPEAFRGDISIKLDTFSFGVVLLELLTSLAPVDENREGVDLFTHVDDICEDDITPLLDVSVGSWVASEINFSKELYKIARKCLEEKKKRPTMSEISKELVDLVQKCL